MSDSLKSPAISGYIDWLGHIEYRLAGNTFTYTNKSYKLIDEMFDLLRTIEPVNKNGDRELWLTSERGSIDDFRDLEDAIADGEVENAEELEEWWLESYPEEV